MENTTSKMTADSTAEMSMETSIKKKEHEKITYGSLFWLFLFGSVVGFVIEGLWSIYRKGNWESHSTLVLGYFCIIYGFGAVAIYLVSALLKGKNLLLQFVVFALAGSAVEYLGSLFQEVVFGSASWDYSGYFMNLNGRICLQMTINWGILGVAFGHFVFPAIVRLLEKTENKAWHVACVLLSVFMLFNFVLSSAAVLRWRERLVDKQMPSNALEQFLDDNYDDEAMRKNYPNLKFST